MLVMEITALKKKVAGSPPEPPRDELASCLLPLGPEPLVWGFLPAAWRRLLPRLNDRPMALKVTFHEGGFTASQALSKSNKCLLCRAGRQFLPAQPRGALPSQHGVCSNWGPERRQGARGQEYLLVTGMSQIHCVPCPI